MSLAVMYGMPRGLRQWARELTRCSNCPSRRNATWLPPHLAYRDVAQFGSASDLGSRGRKFESCYSDHFAQLTI